MMAAVFASFFLGEKIKKIDYVSMLSAFVGVIIVTNPFEGHANSTYSSKDYLIGTVFALTGAVAGGIVSCCMRYMGPGIHYSTGPFYFASGCTFLSPIFYCLNNKFEESRVSIEYNMTTVFYISVCSVIQFLGQITMSRSLQLEKVSILAPLGFL
jgi:drug/metabolite transporter (DMT)-like permease